MSVRVDAAGVTRWGGGWLLAGQLGVVAPLGVVLVTAFLVLRPALRAAPRAPTAPPARRPLLLFAHAVLYAALILVTDRIFGGHATPPGSAIVWLGGWTLLVAVSALALFAFFGNVGDAPLRLFTGSVGLAVAVAAAAWLAGLWSMALWVPLSRVTLQLVATLLDVFFSEVATDPEQLLLQLGPFVVEVAPVCSGFEGIGLISVLLTGYLVAFRRELRFPRALVLVPLGMICVWLGNCVRIAALMALGAYVSEDLAYGAFHSKAGWIVFSAVVLGIAALGHRSSFFSRRTLSDVENPSAAFLLPFVVTAAAALVSEAFESTPGSLYPIRVVAALLTLLVFHREYRALLAVPTWSSVLLGALVGVGWLALSRYEVAPLAAPAFQPGPLWIAARLAGILLFAPLCEELAFRGYLQRWLVARDFSQVSPRTWTWVALGVASVAFGLIHRQPIVGTLAGVAFGVAQIRSGRVGDAIAAHAAANAVLVVAAVGTGDWTLLG